MFDGGFLHYSRSTNKMQFPVAAFLYHRAVPMAAVLLPGQRGFKEQPPFGEASSVSSVNEIHHLFL